MICFIALNEFFLPSLPMDQCSSYNFFSNRYMRLFFEGFAYRASPAHYLMQQKNYPHVCVTRDLKNSLAAADSLELIVTEHF